MDKQNVCGNDRNIVPKKVLIVTALAGFIRGFLSDDIKLLQDMGYEVHCAANANNVGANGIDEYFHEHNAIFHQIDFSSTSPFSKETFKAYKQIKKLIHDNKFEVIHCHTPIAGALTRFSARKIRKKGAKVIYTSHGFYFHKGASKKTWIIYYSIEKFVSLFTDVIITINYEDYEIAKTMYSKNVKHINGVGVDTEKFVHVDINRDDYRAFLGINKNDIMLLSVGELSKRKNHQVIIKALGKLNNPNVIFAICGRAMNGEGTFNELQDLAEENGVRVKFFGFRSDIPQICHCADIGALPSSREGLGLAGIEILASGVPLVASNVQGIKDYMKDDVNGYLYNPYDVDGFAEGISKLSDENTRKNMQEACINAALPFDKDVSNEQMKNIYESRLLSNRLFVETEKDIQFRIM